MEKDNMLVSQLSATCKLNTSSFRVVSAVGVRYHSNTTKNIQTIDEELNRFRHGRRSERKDSVTKEILTERMLHQKRMQRFSVSANSIFFPLKVIYIHHSMLYYNIGYKGRSKSTY